MMDRRVFKKPPPRLLDLFCGAGAVSVGYADAGWDVLGVDIRKQDNYPYEFHQFDAMELVANKGLVKWLGVEVIHASPPCQSYSWSTMHLSYGAPKLIPELRDGLVGLVEEGLIKGYVIENVVNAPLGPKYGGGPVIMLCGTMFGKRVYRHRLFEIGGFSGNGIPDIGWGCDHSEYAINIFMNGGIDEGRNMKEWMNQMFDDRKWMTQLEAKQAVPCCYTEYIGLQLKAELNSENSDNLRPEVFGE